MKRSQALKRKTRLNPRRKRARRTTVRRDPKYLAFIREQACVWDGAPGHFCTFYPQRIRIEASHTGKRPGKGIKADDLTAVPKCPGLHDEWEQHRGSFKGLTVAERLDLSAVWSERYQSLYLQQQRRAA